MRSNMKLRKALMNYRLKCEGFPHDEDLKERLLLCSRQLILQIGPDCPLRMRIKQVDGTVLSRVDIVLPTRKISALVRRKDPVQSIKAAIAVLRDMLDSELDLTATDAA